MDNHKKEEAMQLMLVGIAAAVLGVILTAISSLFFNGGAIIFWGLVVIGGIQFSRGLFGFLANGGIGSLKRHFFTSNDEFGNSLKCNICHKENDKNSKFCIHCGSNIQQNKSKINYEYTLSSSAIALLAYVSKADGIITQNEAKIVSGFLDYLSGDDDNFREYIKNIFNVAKDENTENYKQVAPIFYKIVNNEIDENERIGFLNEFMRWLVFLVFADGSLNKKQSYVTDEIAKILKIEIHYLNIIYDEFSKQNQSSEEKIYKKGAKSINECYEILKCHQNSSNDDVKSAYRVMVRQYHPDIIQGKGLSEDFIFFANQKLQDVNLAYEMIKKHRNI
jgi:DnaJ like chaperone protein